MPEDTTDTESSSKTARPWYLHPWTYGVIVGGAIATAVTATACPVDNDDTNANDERNFSRAVPRRLPAEVAYDALVMATTGDKRAATFGTSPTRSKTPFSISPSEIRAVPA